MNARDRSNQVAPCPSVATAMTLDALHRVAEGIEATLESEFDCDLTNFENRIRLACRHPMLDAAYVIATPEVQRFYATVYDFVLARKSGLYLYGKYRIGKSKAIEYTIPRLEKEFPFMAFWVYDGERKPHVNKERFSRDILEAWNYPFQRNQVSSKVLERFMMTRAVEAGGRVFVLFIDEAQMLSIQHFRFLLETWNGLRRHGFVLVVVLVGQESLPDKKEIIGELDHGAVVARFFTMPGAIGGLRSERELALYLGAFDSELVYPVGSGWSYSRFFLQHAYDGGWRLEASAKHLWAVLNETFKPASRSLLQDGFRLDVVTDTVHSFLMDNMQHDLPQFDASYQRWQCALLTAVDVAEQLHAIPTHRHETV